MRIAYFCPHSDPLAAPGEPDAGGQCVYEAQVAAALATRGHEVRAYTRQWADKSAQATITKGAQVFRYPMGPQGFLRKEDMGPYLAEFANNVLQDQRAWLESVDIIHGHYWDGGGTALLTSIALGRPMAFTSHSLGALKRRQVEDPAPDGSTYRYRIRVPAERKILHAADTVIALSHVEKRALVEHYGIAEEKVTVVPGGVDVEAFKAPAEKPRLKQQLGIETDFMLFTVGRLDPRKGFLELIEAIPNVMSRLAQAGRTATFMLPEGPQRPSPQEASYRSAMVERAEALGVSRHIRWFSRLPDEEMHLHYAAADAFLCPSPYEPFGLVLVEAFSSGTPVVATPHGGPQEIVTQGADGYLAEPSDPEDFSGRILDILLAEPEQRQRMSDAALRKAHERYAWTAVAHQIAAAYEALGDGWQAARKG